MALAAWRPVPAPAAEAAAPANAADAAVPAGGAVMARADSIHHGPRPFNVMLRSAVVPGWGQMYNRKYVKGVAVVAGEGLLAYEAWNEFQKEKDAADRAAAAALAASNRGENYKLNPVYLAADQDRENHLNRKINWIWWGVAAHLLAMVDAYVDAHLSTFNADFGPPEADAGPGAGPRFTLAVRARF